MESHSHAPVKHQTYSKVTEVKFCMVSICKYYTNIKNLQMQKEFCVAASSKVFTKMKQLSRVHEKSFWSHLGSCHIVWWRWVLNSPEGRFYENQHLGDTPVNTLGINMTHSPPKVELFSRSSSPRFLGTSLNPTADVKEDSLSFRNEHFCTKVQEYKTCVY